MAVEADGVNHADSASMTLHARAGGKRGSVRLTRATREAIIGLLMASTSHDLVLATIGVTPRFASIIALTVRDGCVAVECLGAGAGDASMGTGPLPFASLQADAKLGADHLSGGGHPIAWFQYGKWRPVDVAALSIVIGSDTASITADATRGRVCQTRVDEQTAGLGQTPGIPVTAGALAACVGRRPPANRV